MLKMLCATTKAGGCSLSLAVLLFAGLNVLQAQQAQSPSQVPTTSNGTSGFTIHTGVNLVIVDVVVRGPNGVPVKGLKAADFALSEDHKPQRIHDFQEHTYATPVVSAAAPKLAPGLFTNYTTASDDGPANILLLDMLNTPLRDQAYARAQIQDYLNHAPAGAKIAIFGLSNRLTILQGFTSDPAILKAALSKKSATKASSLLDDSVGGAGGDGAGATSVSDALGTLGSTPDILEAVANAQQFEAETQSFRYQVRAQMTLDAMNELARYLVNIPGRKNLIWFSGSFPVEVLPDPSLNNGFATAATSEEEFRETMNLLSRARVALYPVDARGLMNSNTFSATTSGAKYVRSPSAAGTDLAKFDQQMAADNETMQQAAQDTGGRAFVNTNALSDAVEKAIDDGSNYYTLTFSPTDMNWDGRYRKIEIAMPNKAYQLEYRRGYFADDPNARPRQGTAAAALAASPAAQSVITRTMVRGAPVPTQLQFTVRVRRETGTPEPAVATGNELAADSAEARPPFVRYAIDFAIDPRGFSFTQSDDAFHDEIKFVTFVYDQDGNLINRTGATLHADLKAQVYASFTQHPFSYNQDISVPEKGPYFLRIAVQDGNSGRVGAVEVPVDSVKGLAPLSASASPVDAR